MAHNTYWNIDSGDGNELTAGIQLESEALKIAQRMANERGESVYLYEVGNGDDPVIVETMPDHLRGSHRASGNWGVYPHNGAERRIMSRADAEVRLSVEYDHIVCDAKPADAKLYEVAS